MTISSSFRSLVFLVIAPFLMAFGATRGEGLAVHTGSTAQTLYENWMRWIPDSTPLSILSLPATHDSMALFGGGLAQTQSLPLFEQLRAGIRVLDIRARHKDDRFSIYHGIIFQNATFDTVLFDCNAFLQANPSETIVIWLSADGVPAEDNVTRTYADTYRWYRDESGLGNRIYRQPNDFGYNVPLGDVRGKIVVIAGFTCIGCGLREAGVFQDNYGAVNTTFQMPDKWEAIVLNAIKIDGGAADTLYEGAIDGGSGGVWPIDVANGAGGYEGMNYRYLKYLFTGNVKRTTGIIFSDFPGPGLIAAMLAHNMKYATNISLVAPDFMRVLNNLSFSATQDGTDGAADHSLQIQNFLKHILPNEHWSIFATTEFGAEAWGFSSETEGLFGQSLPVDGYSHVAFSAHNVNANVSASELSSYFNFTLLQPLSGNAITRANAARDLLKTHFPQARWHVAVRRLPYNAGNWSSRLDAAASISLPVLDDGTSYLYTAWATSASNRPPVAVVSSPAEINEGSEATLSAALSTDSDGDALQFRWDFDGDGTWDTDYLNDPTITHLFADDQTKSPNVEIFDGISRLVQKVALVVKNVSPTLQVGPHIGLGSDNRLIRQCTIVDPGADTWTVNISYGDGQTAALTLTNRTFMLDHVFPPNGYFEVRVDAKDDGDARASEVFRVATSVPQLSISLVAGGAGRIAWLNHPALFRLEKSNEPKGFNWQSITSAPTLLNGRNQIDINLTNANEIFRLAVP